MQMLLFFVGFLMSACVFVGYCCVWVGSSHDDETS